MCLYKLYVIVPKNRIYLLVTGYSVYKKYKIQKVVVASCLSIMLHHIQFSQQRVLSWCILQIQSILAEEYPPPFDTKNNTYNFFSMMASHFHLGINRILSF